MEVDDLEDADIGYLPFNVIPQSQVNDTTRIQNPDVAPAPAGETAAPVAGNAAPPSPKMLKASMAGAEGRRTNVWRSISAHTRDIEARFEKTIRKHFREIETEVLNQLNALKGWNLVHGIEKADQSSLFDIQFAKGKLMRMTLPLYATAIDRGGTSVLSEIGSQEAFDKLAPNVSMKLGELTRKIVRIDDTVEQQLRTSLVEGLHAGEGVSQLIKRIEDVMDASRARAATIARTETGNAFTSGRVEGMRQAGISKQEWLTARDQFVRDSHQPLDGQVRALDEAFDNGLRYPCDSSGPPEEVINCRCTVVPVVGEPNAA
jgi:SPP1 gp7 family putative phage head morphogenesis protein